MFGGVQAPPESVTSQGGSGGGGKDGSSGGAGSASGEQQASIANTLRQYGLEDLIPLVDSWVRDGLSWSEIEAQLYDPSSQAGKIVDTKYPELRLRREAGRTPMSIAQIRDYRDQTRQLFRAAGLPEGFYDTPEDFTKFIVNDVSLPELNDRINNGFVRVANAPPQVRDELQRLYGIDAGHLAAFFLDETKALPLLQQRVATAEIGGASQMAGFGNLSVNEAESLAQRGVTQGQAQQQFGALASAQELFKPLDAGENAITRQEQLSTFDNNAAAQKRIQDRARRRTAQFEGGGGFASSREGYAGLSTAS
jgi:hypothetical protein